MKTFLMSLISAALLLTAFAGNATEPSIAKVQPAMDIAQTVIKIPLAKDISPDDAVEAMKLRANLLNIKLVAELQLSKQLAAMGEKSGRIEIYQFCNPLTAKKMVDYDINFAAYLPCRITLIEDRNGKGWLVMMNLDILLQDPKLTGSLRAEATHIRDALMEIMQAGASGAL